jgi:predicted Zn-dependent protease with MMP-like domain
MITEEEFEQLVKEGIESIDERFLKKLKNVEIVIEDDPTPYQLEKLKIKGGFLFGLYEGVPQTNRMSYGMVLPDKITIFKNQFEKFFSAKEEIKEAVKNTVWHEIAHHFGMDEEQVRNAERKRNKR